MPIFPAMHIPDGFVSVPVALVGWVLTIILVGIALRQTRQQLGERQMPMLGVLAAFIFAAQMINFPVVGGTSGHLLGGTFVAILLGPWAAVLVMTTVITVQGFLFQDGGLLAMGFNVFNMGIVTTFIGYAVYQLFPRASLWGVAIGAWLSVEFAAAATTLELVVSGTSPLSVTLSAMLGIHALIGIGEALITVGGVRFISQTRPDLLTSDLTNQNRSIGWVALGLVIALAIAFLSPLASSRPDGLERVAQNQAFMDRVQDAPYSLLPDYTIPGVVDENWTTILAGVIGIMVVMAIGFGVARLILFSEPS